MREVIEQTGTVPVGYKLTQKIPGPAGGPGRLTTVYLSAEEHRLLASLPAVELHKVCVSMPPFGIDLFGGELSGLVLDEAEFDPEKPRWR